MSQERSIRVLVVDDHAVVRGGLRLFLLAFDDLDLVGEAKKSTPPASTWWTRTG